MTDARPGPDRWIGRRDHDLMSSMRMEEDSAESPSTSIPTPSVVSVPVDDQEELDRIWDALASDGGQEGRCGWVRDRWGFWWQVVPSAMQRTVGGPDPAGASRAMEAMMGMSRLVVADLEAAYRGD